MDMASTSRPKRRKTTAVYIVPEPDNEFDGDDDSYDGVDLENPGISSDEDCKEVQQPSPKQVSEINIPLSSSGLSSPSRASTPEITEPSGAGSVWSTACKMKAIKFTKENVFFGNPGLTPIDFFNFFFEENFLAMICKKTNTKAEKLFLSKLTRETSRITHWKILTIPELKVFLGLLFHTGTIQLSRLQDYWKKDRLYSLPIFGEQMSRNRFLLILKCLHFSSEVKSEDPLYGIRLVVDYFNEKMNGCYYPAKELCMGESMVLWRGLLKYKQYVKNVKQKNGITLYTLIEPDGLILKFRVRAGSFNSDEAGNKHSEKVVMLMLKEKLQNGHSIYLDDYYNSFGLAKRLLENNTYCSGTLLQTLKENPADVIDATLKQGENISRFRDGVHIGQWKLFYRCRPVFYITTEYKDSMVPVMAKNYSGQTTKKPEAIAKYNEYMAEIDRQDQVLAYYPCEKITLHWHVKIAIHTFQLLFLNSYKIYNKYSGQRKMNFYDYRLAVINKLLPEKKTSAVVAGSTATGSSATGSSATGSSATKPINENGGHKISKITDKNDRGCTKRKSCRMCSKTNKTRKDTIWNCEMCRGKPALCFECFDPYHALL